MSFARRFGAFAASLTPTDLPPEIDAEARRCLLDTIGVAVAGLSHPTVVAARSFANSFLCSGDGGGQEGAGAAPARSAFLAGTAAHVWDYDDTSYAGIMHGSAVVLPAVLAVSSRLGRSDAEARCAFVAGVETAYALGEAMTNATYVDGWWTTGLFGAVGAAAGAARALRLDPAGCAVAIAHAALLAAGYRAVLGTAAKPLGCGHAARLGVEAAGLAAAGLDGRLDAIEHPRGFAAVRGCVLLDIAPPRIGRSPCATEWRLLSPGVARKLFPACSAVQAAGEALRDLMRAHALAATDIVSIDCGAPRLVVESLVFDKPQSVSQAQFSRQAALTCIALFGDLSVHHLEAEAWRAAEAQNLMARITLRPEPDAFDPDAASEGATLRIMLRDGTCLARYNPVATGMPARPMEERDLLAKFAACTLPALGDVRSREVGARVLRGNGNSADLLRLLVGS